MRNCCACFYKYTTPIARSAYVRWCILHSSCTCTSVVVVHILGVRLGTIWTLFSVCWHANLSVRSNCTHWWWCPMSSKPASSNCTKGSANMIMVVVVELTHTKSSAAAKAKANWYDIYVAHTNHGQTERVWRASCHWHTHTHQHIDGGQPWWWRSSYSPI